MMNAGAIIPSQRGCRVSNPFKNKKRYRLIDTALNGFTGFVDINKSPSDLGWQGPVCSRTQAVANTGSQRESLWFELVWFQSYRSEIVGSRLESQLNIPLLPAFCFAVDGHFIELVLSFVPQFEGQLGASG